MTAATRVIADRAAILAEIGRGAADRERAGLDPHAQIDLLRDARLTALTLDVEHGGGGADVVELIDFIIDLAHADPIVAHILRAHFWFVEQVKRIPDGPVRDRWSAEIADGKIFGNATSERSGAAGARAFATTLRQTDDGWSLRGEKFYSTGTSFADYIAVQASAREGLSTERIARLIIPVDRAGVAVIDDWDGIGQHRTGTGSTQFTDVAVSTDDILEFVDLAAPDTPIANDAPLLQLYLQALIAGILLSVTDDAVSLIRSRTRTFDHAPAAEPRHDPVLLKAIGEIDAAAHVSRVAAVAAAAEVEAAFECARRGVHDRELFARASVAAARVKVHVDHVALPTATALFDVGGASSASRARNLDRHWRNIRTITLHNPTSYKAVALGDLAVNGTGLPANGYF